jgi:hypothetical protein
MAKMPEQTHSGNLNRTKVDANPEAGAKSAGKSNDAEATLRKGSLPGSSAVTTVDRDANKGKAKELASANDDGNPKHRTRNVWGAETVKGTGKES